MISVSRRLLQTIVKTIYQSLQIWCSMVLQNLFCKHRCFHLNIFLQLIFLFRRRKNVFQNFLDLSLRKKWLIFLQVIFAPLNHVPGQLCVFLTAVQLTLQVLKVGIEYYLISFTIL